LHDWNAERTSEGGIPVKDSLALTLEINQKPETEPKNGNHFGIDRCDGRSFCGRGSDANLAAREQQQKAKFRQAFLGVGITSSKHPITKVIKSSKRGQINQT
jgi:hypothetical protein